MFDGKLQQNLVRRPLVVSTPEDVRLFTEEGRFDLKSFEGVIRRVGNSRKSVSNCSNIPRRVFSIR